MPIVCPAILAPNLDEYRHDLDNVKNFAERIQVDLSDGEFASNKTINIAEAHWPKNILADLHLMIDNPDKKLPEIISLEPNLAIVHVEAKGDIEKVLDKLQQVDIKVGVALLQKSNPKDYQNLILKSDHVLIFTGELGHYGGKTDMSSLSKIQEVKDINPDVEVGVDGGINDSNIKDIISAGADVLNVGSFIQKSDNPKNAYDKLVSSIEEVKR